MKKQQCNGVQWIMVTRLVKNTKKEMFLRKQLLKLSKRIFKKIKNEFKKEV